LTIEATPAPAGARLWIAEADTPDFRAARWREKAMRFSEGKIVGDVKPSEKRHLAFFGEVDYAIDGVPYKLSTQIRMTE
jgi:hypothetical protein